MPLLSMSGKFYGKLLVCLQEPKGVLGPRVAETLRVPENIYLTVSKSGKMDKQMMKRWIDDCVQPLISDQQIMLIYDSWAGQVDEETYSSLGENCRREKIPAKATSLIQPLDKYIFRQYKIFRRLIFERVMLDELALDMHNRENVLKMHSLIFNQMQSEIFVPMCKYAWYACTYTTEKQDFKNVQELLFSSTYDKCEMDSCPMESFIKCAHCNLHLYFDHFFVEYHYHPLNNDTNSHLHDPAQNSE